MDNIVILDKLDEFSAHFDDKIGQIETNLNGLGQDLSNVKNDTELLAGQQEYQFVAQAISYPAYVICNSAIGNYTINTESGNMTGWKYLYKFKAKLNGEINVLFRGETNKTARISVSNYVIRNLTNKSNVLDLTFYYNQDSENLLFSYENNIPLLKDNEYVIAIKSTESGSQRAYIRTCNIYATTKLITKTISNQIVEIK